MAITLQQAKAMSTARFSIAPLAGVASAVVGGLSGGGSKSSKVKIVPRTAQEQAQYDAYVQELMKLQGKQFVNQGNPAADQAAAAKIRQDLETMKRSLTIGASPGQGVTVDAQGRPVTLQGIEQKLAMSDADLLKAEGIKAQSQQGVEDIPGFKSPEQLIQEEYKKFSDPLLAKFKKLLNTTLTDDFIQNGYKPNEARAASEAFVDATYTNQARAKMSDLQNQFQSNLSAQAASLGRNPAIDSATQSRIFEEMVRGERDIGLERGARVAQRTDELAYNRPLEALQRSVGGLGAYQTQSNFLSDLAQRAMNNRIGLLNLQGGLLDRGFKERYPGSGAGQSEQYNPSLAERVGGGIASGVSMGKGIADIGGLFTSNSGGLNGLVRNDYYIPAGASGRQMRE